MSLATVRQIYDCCEKHHLGCFIPGHHPDCIDINELRPKLLRQRQKIKDEILEALEQSLRIKLARTRIQKKISINKDSPLNALPGLSQEQYQAMLHKFYMSHNATLPKYNQYWNTDFIPEMHYEILLLEEAARELNQMTADAISVHIEYDYTEDKLVLHSEFDVRYIAKLQRNQMDIMLNNYYVEKLFRFSTIGNYEWHNTTQ